MVNGKELSNRLLISMTDGSKVGEIKDIYLDQNAQVLTAVFIAKEGLLGRKKLVLPRTAIQVLGKDAWLVGDSDSVRSFEELESAGSYLLVGDLRGREMETVGGTKIGKVSDVIFDAQGNVMGFALGKVYIKGPLADKKRLVRSAVESLGSAENAMVVNLDKAEALDLPE